MTVKTRIEPAPSGRSTSGTRARRCSAGSTRRHGGSFVLRIADTDAKRATEENYRAVLTEEERRAFDDEGRGHSLRFQVPGDRTITFQDAVLGELSTARQILLREAFGVTEMPV